MDRIGWSKQRKDDEGGGGRINGFEDLNHLTILNTPHPFSLDPLSSLPFFDEKK